MIGNVEHDERIIIVLYDHLVGRSAGENTANSSCGSSHTTHIPGCIGMDLGIFIVGTYS
jgi:hypothetical protein